MNADLECDEPGNVAVNDKHAGGFSLIFILLILLMAVYCHQLKNVSRKHPHQCHHPIWFHIRTLCPIVLRHKRKLNFSQSFTKNGSYAVKSPVPR